MHKCVQSVRSLSFSRPITQQHVVGSVGHLLPPPPPPPQFVTCVHPCDSLFLVKVITTQCPLLFRSSHHPCSPHPSSFLCFCFCSRETNAVWWIVPNCVRQRNWFSYIAQLHHSIVTECMMSIEDNHSVNVAHCSPRWKKRLFVTKHLTRQGFPTARHVCKLDALQTHFNHILLRFYTFSFFRFFFFFLNAVINVNERSKPVLSVTALAAGCEKIVAGCRGGEVCVLDPQSESCLQTHRNHEGMVNDLAVVSVFAKFDKLACCSELCTFMTKLPACTHTHTHTHILSFSLWSYQSLLQICHSTLTRGCR